MVYIVLVKKTVMIFILNAVYEIERTKLKCALFTFMYMVRGRLYKNFAIYCSLLIALANQVTCSVPYVGSSTLSSDDYEYVVNLSPLLVWV